MDDHLARFAGNGERDLAFEIEMLLPADLELALEPMRRGGKRALDVAAAVSIVGQHALAGDQRVGDRDRRLRFLDVDLGEARGAARGVAASWRRR